MANLEHLSDLIFDTMLSVDEAADQLGSLDGKTGVEVKVLLQKELQLDLDKRGLEVKLTNSPQAGLFTNIGISIVDGGKEVTNAFVVQKTSGAPIEVWTKSSLERKEKGLPGRVGDDIYSGLKFGE